MLISLKLQKKVGKPKTSYIGVLSKQHTQNVPRSQVCNWWYDSHQCANNTVCFPIAPYSWNNPGWLCDEHSCPYGCGKSEPYVLWICKSDIQLLIFIYHYLHFCVWDKYWIALSRYGSGGEYCTKVTFILQRRKWRIKWLDNVAKVTQLISRETFAWHCYTAASRTCEVAKSGSLRQSMLFSPTVQNCSISSSWANALSSRAKWTRECDSQALLCSESLHLELVILSLQKLFRVSII